MDFELTEEQRIFREAIKNFAENEIGPLVEEAEETEVYPVELIPKAGKLGFLCVRYPEKYGAAGTDKLTENIYIEELMRVCSGIGSGLLVQSSLGTSMILEHGTDEQKQDYLVPAIKGDKISAFGLTEPNSGSDAASMQTTAVKDGDHYVINGRKIFITNGSIADFVCVATYTDKSKGPKGGVSIFIVDKGIAGFSVTRKLKKVGNRSADTAELLFEDCRVSKDNLVGEEGKGFPYLIATLKSGRISYGGRCIGVSRAALEASIKYAGQRVQFGKPIKDFQVTRFKLARMAMEIEAARWLTYRASWLYDQGKECMKEASMVKLYASEVAQRVTSEAMQIHGGYGYMMEYPIQRHWRDARLLTVTEGTTEIQHIVIARELGI